jgi:FAD/FMN-containing dehydrogenase
MDPTHIAEFRSTLRGTLLQSGDAEYETARLVWNGMIDRRPRLIVRCCGVADVVAAVRFAHAQGLLVAVRGGGHNVAGYGTCEDGMVIDLSFMRSVHVDPAAQTAWVQGGATWRDVDWETTAFGLATPGGVVSTTGVGGLTLSGGMGWLRGTRGLCIDNLLSVDIVLADGHLLRANETENSDLFWAVRGGGGNFGIVTAFQFRLHPIEPELMVCLAVYTESRAREIIASWRDFMATAPDQLLGSIVEFSTLPDDRSLPLAARGARAISVGAVYDGAASEGEALVRPLRELAPTLVDFSGRMSYCTIQSLQDDLFPKARDRSYFKSLYLNNLDPPVINEIVDALARRPSEMTFTSVWKFGGAVARVAPNATAFGDRSMPYMLSIDTIWSNAEDDSANISWTRKLWSNMLRHSDGRFYLNFPGHGEDANLVRTAVGTASYERLVTIKRTYDPTNFFRINQNILPD